jgi:hypothetical protein
VDADVSEIYDASFFRDKGLRPSGNETVRAMIRLGFVGSQNTATWDRTRRPVGASRNTAISQQLTGFTGNLIPTSIDIL